jgi:hypothetical protein
MNLQEIRVIIAGSRKFNNYTVLKEKCDKILSKFKFVTIISGGANGADHLGEKYAVENLHQLEIIRADWDTHGKSAGYLRNVKMAENADSLIAFWDGKSKGTEHMINIAKEKKLKVRIIKYE